MKNSLIKLCSLSILATALSTTSAGKTQAGQNARDTQPAATPATETTFTLPMTDNTNANALILPAPNNQAWLVYATSTGQIGSYSLVPANASTPPTPSPSPSPAPSPAPTPPPSPAPTPTPPLPTWIDPSTPATTAACPTCGDYRRGLNRKKTK